MAAVEYPKSVSLFGRVAEHLDFAVPTALLLLNVFFLFVIQYESIVRGANKDSVFLFAALFASFQSILLIIFWTYFICPSNTQRKKAERCSSEPCDRSKVEDEKEREQYEEDRMKWMKERKFLIRMLREERASSELYKNILRGMDKLGELVDE